MSPRTLLFGNIDTFIVKSKVILETSHRNLLNGMSLLLFFLPLERFSRFLVMVKAVFMYV